MRIASCDNFIEPDGPYCDGYLVFEPGDLDTPCVKCGARCGRLVASYVTGDSTWSKTRETGWHRDIGYEILSALRLHSYDSHIRGSEKPDDPGWHVCRCGAWQGYWSSWHIHVTDHVRSLVLVQLLGLSPEQTVRRAERTESVGRPINQKTE
jgi:hypothetical protein